MKLLNCAMSSGYSVAVGEFDGDLSTTGKECSYGGGGGALGQEQPPHNFPWVLLRELSQWILRI